MRRFWVGLLFACACGGEAAKPPVVVEVAPPKPGTPIVVAAKPAAPAPPPAPAVPVLAGTFWQGRDSDGDELTLEFRADGKLHYRSPTGTYDNGTWEQHEERITWETNGHYADYEGTVRGDTIDGSAHNVANHDWTFHFERAASFDGAAEDIPLP